MFLSQVANFLEICKLILRSQISEFLSNTAEFSGFFFFSPLFSFLVLSGLFVFCFFSFLFFPSLTLSFLALVLKEYMGLQSFEGIDFETAMRRMLKRVELPREGQRIDRVLKTFGIFFFFFFFFHFFPFLFLFLFLYLYLILSSFPLLTSPPPPNQATNSTNKIETFPQVSSSATKKPVIPSLLLSLCSILTSITLMSRTK